MDALNFSVGRAGNLNLPDVGPLYVRANGRYQMDTESDETDFIPRAISRPTLPAGNSNNHGSNSKDFKRV